MKTLGKILILLPFIALLSAHARQFQKEYFTHDGISLLMQDLPILFTDELTISDLSSLNTSDVITSFQNTVELNLVNNCALSVDATVKITADLTYYLLNGSKIGPIKIILEVDLKAGGLTKNKISNVYAFVNAYKVELSITLVEVSDGSGTASDAVKAKVRDLIELDITFQKEQITRIQYTAVVSNLTACRDEGTDELVIHWTKLVDAEEYELEYTFIDDYDDNDAAMNPNRIAYNFKDNCARISLKDTYYRFPLLLERGYVVYRVRAVGRGGTHLELPVYCQWSGGASGSVGSFSNKDYHDVAHMKDNINWQVATTFAEDGKRSDVMNYFDGTFRSRQTVTGVNLEKMAISAALTNFPVAIGECSPGSGKARDVIAGENVYDFQGRAAVNILPVPTNSLKIEYLPRLNNRDATNIPYSWQDFDKPGYACAGTVKLSSDANSSGIMGAAAYYSGKNPNKLGFNAFIPEAAGYPFTQISYLQDNTGRMAAQSGVGETFQLGKGHETKYYYAAPNQQELDMLFGTEAGDALRYQKNAVQDANGQMAVTIINPEGKTVVTALAGKKPDNVEALDNQIETSISVSLMDKNVLNHDDKTLITEHQFLVTTDLTDYTFDYSITPETLDAMKCDETPVCLDCIYDIDITLKHNESCENVPLLKYSGKIGDLLNIAGDPDLRCDNSAATGDYPRQQTITLNIGTYVITKKITVNKQAGLAYVAEVFKDTCKTKWDELLKHEVDSIHYTDCYKSCLDCAQPPVQTEICDTAYCKPDPNRCAVIKGMLLADISPGGQYAQFVRKPDGSIDASDKYLSIFNLKNYLPCNLRDTVILGVHSVNMVPVNIFQLLHSKISSFPETFDSPSEGYNYLANNWLPEYAEALLELHPEAFMLGWCNQADIDTTLDYDVQILSAQYFSDAAQKGFVSKGYSPVNAATAYHNAYEQLLYNDLWFLNSQNPAYRDELLYKLQHSGCDPDHPLPADVAAMQMAWCAHNNELNEPVQNPDGTMTLSHEPVMDQSLACTPDPTAFDPNNFGKEPDLADLQWTFLRSFYLSAKNKVLEKSMQDYAVQHNCDSRCIGADYYFSWGFLNSNSLTPPCQMPWWSFILYTDKERRFGSAIHKIFDVMDNAGIHVDLTNGTLDSCQAAQAILNQSAGINQSVASNGCGDTDGNTVEDPCVFKYEFLSILNGMISQLHDNITTVAYPNSIPPHSILSPYIDGITVSIVNQNSLRILLEPCDDPFYIPYLQTSSGKVAPVSLCCINKCPLIDNCTFSFQVTYANEATRIIQIRTKCNILQYCDSTKYYPCPQPSEYVHALEGYLNEIFHIMAVYGTPPSSSAQLKNLLPPILRKINGKPVLDVTLDQSSDFVLSFYYHGGGPGLNKKKCDIVLKHKAAIGYWSKVKHVFDMRPDLSLADQQTHITNAFKLKLLSGTVNNLSVVNEVQGNVQCWPMNQCPRCDTIYWLPDTLSRPDPCPGDLLATAYANAAILYHSWLDSAKNDLLNRYYAKCMKAVENFNITYKEKQYHYTLYYYDQAGNLVKTVPPSGVRPLNSALISKVVSARAKHYALKVVVPQHVKTTVYRYNTLNQPIWQKTPDADTSYFYYDGLGRIVASQNTQQKADRCFSYIRYDKLGRIFESGKLQTDVTNAQLKHKWDAWENFINNQNNRTEITYTKYDERYSAAISSKFGPAGQRNLRTRVVSIFRFQDKDKLVGGNYDHATHYTYDMRGNVYKLIQDYPNGILGDKTLEYDYDLQSGKVNSVTYQRGAPDQFIHRYDYDALNRLIRVKTSANDLIYETDAEYFYYRHGPLARFELGTDKVQGLDYMYTLQGGKKGVNGTTTSPETDMGQDGIITPPGQAGSETQQTSQIVFHNGHAIQVYGQVQLYGDGFNGPGYGALHSPVARDAYGYVLDYYQKDFSPIQGNTCLSALQNGPMALKDLYNGNIARMYTQLPKLDDSHTQAVGNCGFDYTYDQLNRIISQDGWYLKGSGSTMTMTPLPNGAYYMALTYDADGNILKLRRNGAADKPDMDKLEYRYYTQNGSVYDPATEIPPYATNKLARVTDKVPADNYTEDLDNQTNKNIYEYDLIGNLIKDKAEKISTIEWNLQNKVSLIKKVDGTIIQYAYDALGNRVMKAVSGGPHQDVRTFYTRDAQGNIMATYCYKMPGVLSSSNDKPKFFWNEAIIYGSSRVGAFKPDTVIPVMVTTTGTTGGLTPGNHEELPHAEAFTNATDGLPASSVVQRNDNLFGGIIYQHHQTTAPKPESTQDRPAGAYFIATRGYKNYELSNHLGNVLATITDRKLPHILDDGTLDYYTADISSSQDYYPFGMEMPGRKYQPDKYKFGFNGKLKDDEVYGEGSFQDYGFRMYDTRVCRFISVDPLTKKYPELTPYQFASNTPMKSIDIDGLEQTSATGATGTTTPGATGATGTTAPGVKGLTGTEGPVGNTPLQSDNNSILTIVKDAIWIVLSEGDKLVDKLKGHAKMPFGIVFETKDGKWNGNTTMTVTPGGKTITINYDEFKLLEELFGYAKRDEPYWKYKNRDETKKELWSKFTALKNGCNGYPKYPGASKIFNQKETTKVPDQANVSSQIQKKQYKIMELVYISDSDKKYGIARTSVALRPNTEKNLNILEGMQQPYDEETINKLEFLQ